MLNIFKRNKTSEYQERLSKAFPKMLQSDLKVVLKILPLKNHKVKLHGGKIYEVDSLIYQNDFKLKIDNETITIPQRLYFDEPNPEIEKTLTDRQREIINCIYLRHHDGYLREKRLKLMSNTPDKWTTPYITQLIGEYVYELLPIIDKKVNESTLEFYTEFINENPNYWQKTERRMVSYWNAYYRHRYPKLKEYLGFAIVNRIKKTKAQRL